VTASRRSTALHLAALLATGLGLGACLTPGAAPLGSAFQSHVRFSLLVPDAADRTVAKLAHAALVSDTERTARALKSLEALDTVLEASDEKPTGLMPVSTDLANTTLDDLRAYRKATEQLLERDDIGPAMRERLERFERDDPLRLASDRIRDAWVLDIGRAFNALAEPVGRSIFTMTLAPYRLARSIVSYAIEVYQQEALPLQRRQALAHWKTFLRRHPYAPEAEVIAPKVDAAQARWQRTHRDRALRVAQFALQQDKVRLALIYADRALRYMPEDRRAAEVRDEAAQRLLEIRDRQRRSVQAAPAGRGQPAAPEARQLTLALLRPGADLKAAARRLRDRDPDGPLADEARFAETIALGEAGARTEMWDELEALADEAPEDSNMARHAQALLADPDLNVFGAFEAARHQNTIRRTLWVIFGPFAGGPRHRGLPRSLEWLIDVPTAAQAVFTAPMRLLQLPWSDALPTARVAAYHADRYLEHQPGGEHAEDVRDWLEDYERDRDNWIGALRIAAEDPDANTEELAELREKAAQQSLEAASRERNRGLRHAMYRRVAREFSGTRAGKSAGYSARAEVENATAQRIRISRGFLEENPRVAGPYGLGLKPEFLDEDVTNGELHPDGVTLLGGRTVEISYVGASGDEKDPPLQKRETLDEEHLTRFVSSLEEASYRNTLLDVDDTLGPDAQRDTYFERVRLGLTDQTDGRPTATSDYAYRGMRERYGMVRARDSILPFDLVLQGSFHDLSLGAFPRIRAPKETPDAFLYK
jgi:hypothetical protein